MADSRYPYAPDQFDREAEDAVFHGAHRADEPFWRQNLMYLIIIAVALLTLIALLFAIGGGDRSGGSADPGVAQEQTATEEDADAPTEEDATEDGEATEEEPAAEPDLSTPVMVLNASGVNQLAGDWRDSLEGEGWNEVFVGTADTVQEEALVYYRDEEDADSANALAQQVGVDEAQQSDEYDSRITFLAVTPPEGD